MPINFSAVLRWVPWSSSANAPSEFELPTTEVADLPRQAKIEDYRLGYPQFSALIAAHDSFFAFRTFRRMRSRLLLNKQDKLTALEQQLDRIDREETSPLFLGKIRCDNNEARASCLAQIETCLESFDDLAHRTRQALAYNRANSRDVRSLQNWIDGTSCIDAEETSYLERELITLASHNDSAMKQLEDWVEDQLVDHYQNFRTITGQAISANEDVFIYRGKLIKELAKTIMLLLIVFLLLLPVLLCIILESPAARITVIFVSTCVYLAVVARLTGSKMIELIVAGATFATILIVFVSNTDSVQGTSQNAPGRTARAEI